MCKILKWIPKNLVREHESNAVCKLERISVNYTISLTRIQHVIYLSFFIYRNNNERESLSIVLRFKSIHRLPYHITYMQFEYYDYDLTEDEK